MVLNQTKDSLVPRQVLGSGYQTVVLSGWWIHLDLVELIPCCKN